MAASYRSIASGMHPARSLARASCNRSAAGRTAPGPGMRGRRDGESNVIRSSPRHRVLGEVVDLPCHPLGEQVVERQQVIEDVQVVVDISDVLGQQLAE